ncbi:hypothetical protein ACOME3_006502 [Neoechinorhynchus agilis]
MTERYGFSLTTFSPTGKLVQIEYALNAVTSAPPSVAIKAKNGVVLATEKKVASSLHDHESIKKINKICHNIGMVYSGLGPDYRLLLTYSRQLAQQYIFKYEPNVPPIQLVKSVADVMQEYTQSGGVRPFGVSLLIGGYDYDKDEPYVFQCDPSGSYFAWKATVLGRNYMTGRAFLEKRYNENLMLEDAVHTAVVTLKELFEGQMNEDNIEIGICDKENGFRVLSANEVKDYLSGI